MDRISNHIPSFPLPTKLRAQTSVPSKKMAPPTPVLDFHVDDLSTPTELIAVVDRCLRLYPNTTHRLLRLRPPAPTPASQSDPSTPGSASSPQHPPATSPSASKTALTRTSSMNPSSPFSLPLLSLPHFLKLSFCTSPQIDQHILGFPALKTLFLDGVVISDEAVELLISKSSLLETLNLDFCREISRIEISSARNPRIENLNLSIRRIKEAGRVLVDAPRLRFFEFNGNVKKLELRDAPRLVGAEISAFCSELCESKEQWLGIVSAIESALLLYVTSWFFQDEDDSFEIRGPMFKNLAEFLWDGHALSAKSRLAIIFFLRECPALKSFYINVHFGFYAGLMYEHEAQQVQYFSDLYPFEDIDTDPELVVGNLQNLPREMKFMLN